MKTIYWNYTSINPRELPTHIDATLVVRGIKHVDLTYRVTLHWDRYYAHQSHGEIAVLSGVEFKTVLALHHHDMELFEDFDGLPPPRRGEIERAGNIPDLLLRQAEALAQLGSRIVEKHP